MMRLNTLGGAVLYDDRNQPIGGAARHRRTIGLLSVLVVAGEAGLTRDKLVGIFWPNFDQKRARHSLTQALYAARKATGHEDLFDAGEDVRLNFNHISSDVRDFESRIREKDYSAACRLYRGPFLDGFYLQSVEFDQWQSQERARVDYLAADAFSRAMSEAENQGDFPRAVEYARRLTTIRPTDAAAVLELMRLLANNGDRPAALSQASQYATIVRDQYEMEPDVAVVEYADELREPMFSPVIAGQWRQERDATLTLAPETVAHENTTATSLVIAEPLREVRTKKKFSPFAFTLVAMIVAVLAIVLKPHRAREPEAVLHQRMLIAPFRVNAADPALSYLSEGMIELLAARLADDSVDRAMDAAAIIRTWRSADVKGLSEAPIQATVAVAQKAGAERVLTGSIVGSPRHVVINASLISVASQQITTRATVEGSTDTLAALVDNLARKLLLAQAEPEERLAERMTVSLPALRAFVHGTSAYARGDYAVAQRSYDRAFRLDPTFGLAALRLSMAAARMADFEVQRLALDQAWRAQASLSEKDKAFVRAQLGPRYPAASTLTETVAAWNRAARLSPERPEVWAGLGAAIYEREIATRNHGDRESVVGALERALDLDPGYVAANVLLAHVKTERPLPDRAVAGIAAQSAAPFLTWLRSAMNSGPSQVASRDSLLRYGPANLRAISLASEYFTQRRADGVAAVDLLLSKASDADEAMALLAAQHSMAINAGDAARALDATSRMQRTRPAGRAHLRLRVLDALYDGGDSIAAAAAVKRLEKTPGVPGVAADVCVSAQWHVARGELDEAMSALEMLRSQTSDTPYLAGVAPAVCVPFVEAAMAVASGSPQAGAQLQALDSIAFTSTGVGDLAAYANIAVAGMHRMMNSPQEALAAIRRRPYGSAVWPRYLEASLKIEAELCAVQTLPQEC